MLFALAEGAPPVVELDVDVRLLGASTAWGPVSGGTAVLVTGAQLPIGVVRCRFGEAGGVSGQRTSCAARLPGERDGSSPTSDPASTSSTSSPRSSR